MYYIIYIFILILLLYLYKKYYNLYFIIGILVLSNALTNIIYYKKIK